MWERGYLLLWIKANQGRSWSDIERDLDKYLNHFKINFRKTELDELKQRHLVAEKDGMLNISELGNKLCDELVKQNRSIRLVFSEFGDNGEILKGIRSYIKALKNNDKVLYDFSGKYEQFKKMNNRLKG